MSKRTFEGTVVSNKMQKTVIVAVDVPTKHAIYAKAIKLTKRMLAKDELGCVVGDHVQIEETRPFSKKVSWIVLKKFATEAK